MKARAVVVLDFEFDSFIEAGNIQKRIEAMIEKFKEDNPDLIEFSDFDIKERRTRHHGSVRDMKLVNKV